MKRILLILALVLIASSFTLFGLDNSENGGEIEHVGIVYQGSNKYIYVRSTNEDATNNYERLIVWNEDDPTISAVLYASLVKAMGLSNREIIFVDLQGQNKPNGTSVFLLVYSSCIIRHKGNP